MIAQQATVDGFAAARLAWLGRLPHSLLIVLSWMVGGLCFVSNRHGCRRQTATTLRAALGCSAPQAWWLTMRQNCNAICYALDGLRFAASDDGRILSRLDADIGDSEEVLDQLRRGQGVVLAASFFACFQHVLLIGLIRARSVGARLVVVRPGADPAFDDFRRRAERIARHPMEIVELDGPAAALRVRSALRGGAVVVCLIDNVVDGASLVPTKMFGRPSCLVAGYLLLAQRLGTPIYLCYGRSIGPRFSLVLRGPVLADPALPPLEAVAQLADALNDRLETAVRAAPQHWDGWSALRKKWAIGAQLVQADMIEEPCDVAA